MAAPARTSGSIATCYLYSVPSADALEQSVNQLFNQHDQVSAAAISSRIAGSSMVDGTRYSVPAAIERIVPRRIFPLRVFGSRATIRASRKTATAPT